MNAKSSPASIRLRNSLIVILISSGIFKASLIVLLGDLSDSFAIDAGQASLLPNYVDGQRNRTDRSHREQCPSNGPSLISIESLGNQNSNSDTQGNPRPGNQENVSHFQFSFWHCYNSNKKVGCGLLQCEMAVSLERFFAVVRERFGDGFRLLVAFPMRRSHRTFRRFEQWLSPSWEDFKLTSARRAFESSIAMATPGAVKDRPRITKAFLHCHHNRRSHTGNYRKCAGGVEAVNNELRRSRDGERRGRAL